ncbi:MAG: Ig-like domain repeat protein, partial [Actinobacteria bacterium]|nr:Ig-like domain repeat protein [Actinomycetota bacterium]
MVWGTLIAVAGPASAGVGFGVTPTFPSNVTVGQTNLPGSLQIVNNATAPDNLNPVVLNTITLVPSCGTPFSSGAGDCPAGFADPGVFQLSPTAVGEAGTACAGQNFFVTVVDPATGKVAFTPANQVVLQPPGTPGGDVCRIQFTFDVLRAPSIDSQPAIPGLQTSQIGFAQGTNVVTNTPGIGIGSSNVTVALASPTIITQATTPVEVGTPITDTATLSGGEGPGGPTGTITFDLFGPNDAACANSIFNDVVPVAGNGNYTSGPFIPTQTGTYQWVAVYSGDANNNPATSPCGAPNEASVVETASPQIVTVASPAPAVLPGPVTDTATLSGGFQPTGTITFTLFGPGDPTCAGPPIFTSAPVPVNGNGDYVSPPFVITAGGTYQWIAAYSGDDNNDPVTTACGDPNESVTAQSSPTIVTVASPAVVLGNPVFDTATLAGGTAVPPITGTITFTLYGPNDPACAGPPAFTSAPVPVNGNGDYVSPSFVPTLAGTYQWVAAYSGDAFNNPATSPCGAPNESVVVSPVTPTIVTVASPSVPVGTPVRDTATLSGGTVNPPITGTIVFTLFGPNDPTCAGPPAFTSAPVPVNGNGDYVSPDFVPTAAGTYQCGPNDLACASPPIFTSAPVPVNGNGNYVSPNFVPTLAGTYQWVAAYSGDANNNPVTSPCGAVGESVVVTPTNPTLITNASAPVPVGGATVHDTATLSGGTINPPITGNIVFSLFGPDDATCAGPPVFVSPPVAVNGNGNYDSPDFTPTQPGLYRWIATYSGDVNNAAVTTACNDVNEQVDVTPATPQITTNATASAPVGGPISDSATLTNGFLPTGTIVFTLFGPNDATCAGPPVFTSPPVPVNGNGTYSSAAVTPALAGVYRWIATYSGDANTVASPSVPLGGTIRDTATLTGGTNPTGTITFNVYGPNDATCSGPVAFTATVPVNGAGSYQTPLFTPTLPGVYRFVATYSGDVTNLGVGPTACNDPAEQVLVTATPALVTSASATVPEGGAIHDTAVLSGASLGASGTITFTLFGPDNATCTGTPIATFTVVVAGNGSYPSPDFVTQIGGPAGPGTYRFIAAYSGDANNAPAGPTACDDPAEAVVVTNVVPTIDIVSTATPLTRPEPGGTFTFDVVVTNPTAETVTISGLADNVYGNLSTRGTCTTAIGTVLAPGATYTCSFLGEFAGLAPVAQTNTTTVTVVDNIGATAAAADDATVGLTPIRPSIAVTTTASPPSLPVPGGSFTFIVTVTNTSIKQVQVSSLVDAVFGNLQGRGTCAVGIFLAPGASYTCSFVGVYTGTAPASRTHTVTAGAVDSLGGQATAIDGAVVTLTAGPTSLTTVASPAAHVGGQIHDTATVTGATGTVPPIGGSIIFTLFGPDDAACSNPPVFTSPVVAVSGNGSYGSANFTPTAAGTYRWVAAYSGDINNLPATTACDDANEISLVTPFPIVSVQLTATPPSRPAPGGTFTFAVVVTNISSQALTITAMTDDVYGDLSSRGTCTSAVGASLVGNGGAYECGFATEVSGVAGESRTSTLTVTAVDSIGTTAVGRDDATIT